MEKAKGLNNKTGADPRPRPLGLAALAATATPSAPPRPAWEGQGWGQCASSRQVTTGAAPTILRREDSGRGRYHQAPPPRAGRGLRQVPGASEGRPAPPAPHPSLPWRAGGAASRERRRPCGPQPRPRPALTLHVVQLGPLLLQFALEALGLALQRRQRLVLVQPVGGHLRGDAAAREASAGRR